MSRHAYFEDQLVEQPAINLSICPSRVANGLSSGGSLRDRLTIEDVLDQGLPRAYTPDLYRQKCAAVFEHVYETYGDRGHSIYGIVG
ncbi:MAG: hypothetical protein NNA23_09555 [Nitrospira sp.]|nr:hypothetical protein [Nitrospira sp.]